MINKSDSRCAVVGFCYHSYDNRPKWTQSYYLSPITITYYIYFEITGDSCNLIGSQQYYIRELHKHNYDSCLFQAMCSLAFFACMRVGELTLTTTKDRGSLIQLHQLTQLVDVDQRVIALKFTFLDFKHNYNQRPFSVVEIVETIFVLYKSSWTICPFVGAGQGLFFAWQMVPLCQEIY